MGELKRQEKYEGTVVQVGNSRGMRLPAGFFHAHPEFSGKVQVTVVADGTVLVSARPTSKRKPKADEGDPVVASFLQFMDKQMLGECRFVRVVCAQASGNLRAAATARCGARSNEKNGAAHTRASTTHSLTQTLAQCR